MDLHQLRVFRAAAKGGGFTRAGEQLHLSQSTVSQHMKLLEEELGCPLFLRVGKRVLVTEAGEILLQYAERMFRDLNNAEMAVRELSTMQRGTVRLGVGPTTLTYRLPHVLAEYKRRFPDIELMVLAGTTDFMLGALWRHELDLAVVMTQSPQPGLSITPLGNEELVLVVNRDHPLADRGSIDPSDLTSLRFILYGKNTAMQNLIERYFQSLGVTPRIVMEVENNEAIKSLVRVGLGASILPLCSIENEPPSGAVRLLRVKGAPLTRELSLAVLDAESLPNAIRELGVLIGSALRR